MYTTPKQRIEMARTAWEAAQATLDKLGRTIDRADREAECTPTTDPVAYNLACVKVEILRVQFAALATKVDAYWQAFESAQA